MIGIFSTLGQSLKPQKWPQISSRASKVRIGYWTGQNSKVLYYGKYENAELRHSEKTR